MCDAGKWKFSKLSHRHGPGFCVILELGIFNQNLKFSISFLDIIISFFLILRVLVILLSLCLFLMVFLAISDCFGVLLIHVFIVIPI